MEAYVMDAFSASLFGGNQAGVVLPDRPLTDAEMQQIAAEFKHSETAFVTRSPDGSVILRYFTGGGGGALRPRHHRLLRAAAGAGAHR